MVYDITDLPELYNSEQVFAVLGIASAKQDKYNVKVKDELPECISSDDYGFTVGPLQTEIKRHYGERFRIFSNGTTAIFIQELYLSLWKKTSHIRILFVIVATELRCWLSSTGYLELLCMLWSVVCATIKFSRI